MISEEDFLQKLAAFSDGELDLQQRIEILEYVAANPDAITLMIAQEQFRADVRAQICRFLPQLPLSLNRRLQELSVHGHGTQS